MDIAIIHIQRNLDAIKKEHNGLDYWSARDLMEVLGYTTWAKFQEAIKRAKESCKISGQEVPDHFCRRRQNGLDRIWG